MKSLRTAIYFLFLFSCADGRPTVRVSSDFDKSKDSINICYYDRELTTFYCVDFAEFFVRLPSQTKDELCRIGKPAVWSLWTVK